MPIDNQNSRKLIAGRWLRWNDERAAHAYARGLWTPDTLADYLRKAAQQTPHRVLLIDGDCRIDCQTLFAQASALARAMLVRIPTGSVVSFMLPNWHEAAVIYLAATMSGMVVNPILPSLRDRELLFILKDVTCRLIFVPASIRQQDYVAMMSRVTAQLTSPPEVVVLRGDPANHTPYESLFQQKHQATELPVLNPDAVRMILY